MAGEPRRAGPPANFAGRFRLGRQDSTGVDGRRSTRWVALAVGAAILGVLNALCSTAWIIAEPNFITITSALFVVAWYWIAVGAWRESGRRGRPTESEVSRPAEPAPRGR
jgi:hypothetical protein